MPDAKISADATVTPAGADFLPILQGGANKKATIASLPISTATQSALDAKGTVSSVSSANARATVANGTTTPVITIVSAPIADTVTTNANLTGDVTSVGNSTTLANTAVTPGSYTLSNITVDSKGRITAASNGTASGTGDVVGPASAVDSNFAAFDTATGKLIKDSTKNSTSFAAALGTDDNYVTDAEKTKLSNLSGTNTGDQTSIVGISGTKSEFDTAVSDGNFVFSGDSPSLGTVTTTGNIELGNASDTTISRVSAGVVAVEGVTVPTISSTSTLTNKRITKRLVTTTQSATPTINTDNGDIFKITGLAQAITSFTTNLTGTPVEGDLMMIQVTDNGTARALAFGASFEASTVALPTTTTISTLIRILFQWNATTSKWSCVAVV